MKTLIASLLSIVSLTSFPCLAAEYLICSNLQRTRDWSWARDSTGSYVTVSAQFQELRVPSAHAPQLQYLGGYYRISQEEFTRISKFCAAGSGLQIAVSATSSWTPVAVARAGRDIVLPGHMFLSVDMYLERQDMGVEFIMTIPGQKPADTLSVRWD